MRQIFRQQIELSLEEIEQNGVPICCCFERARLRCTDYTSTSLHDARSGMSTWLDHSRESEHDVGFDFSAAGPGGESERDVAFDFSVTAPGTYHLLIEVSQIGAQEDRDGVAVMPTPYEALHSKILAYSEEHPGSFTQMLEIRCWDLFHGMNTLWCSSKRSKWDNSGN
ncbi:unnamed protein product, partial [Mesorhabditis belari]|uniref:Uncharacterized protein n=1 Tax=Mesorhabditis belari TaxID=2138241 RepID=A0AAF3EU24_9BILA